MLTISKPMSGSSAGDYYTELAREDYYTEGGEPPGHWSGEGAEKLGLRGQVEKEELRNILNGFSADGQKALVQNAGAEDRQAAWDGTYSAPKSVSVLWATGDSDVRREIQAAQREAVAAGNQYLQEEAGFTRRGKGGEEKERAALVFATFEHGTSRAQDPQLHTHSLIMNSCVRDDGTTGTIESTHIFRHKMAAGAIYRAELAHQLEKRLEVHIRREKGWFEVEGVDKKVIEEFSKRREAIEASLKESGFSGAVAAKIAALDTRAVKEHVAREELFRLWPEVAKELGWGKKEVEAVLNRPATERDPEKEKAVVTKKALERATERESHFTKRDLVRYAAEEAQGRGLSSKEVKAAVEECLSQKTKIIELGKADGETRYTTKEMIELERRMLKDVSDGAKENFWPVKSETVEQSFEGRELSEEQKRAVSHVTEREGSVQLISGMAGSGKSTTLGTARDVWQAEGYDVIGAAPSGKAARELQNSAGIESQTIHRTLRDIERGDLNLSSRTVLVVDEAGMVGTKLMSRLVSETREAGSKLVLVGDEKQLQSVDAGGAFQAFSGEVGRAELKEIRRQREEWARDAVIKIAYGEADKFLKEYNDRGLLSVSDTGREAKEELLSSWKRAGVLEPEKNLIVCSTNADAKALNEGAQTARYAAGKLTGSGIEANGYHFYQGDRLLFTKNDNHLGVRNGEIGTVERASRLGKMLDVKMDGGRKVELSLKDYKDVKLGYAITTHKSQGATVENAFVLVGGSMQDRELSYVQASRARGDTKLFTDQQSAGDALKDLKKTMGKSHQKELASTIAKRQGVTIGR